MAAPSVALSETTQESRSDRADLRQRAIKGVAVVGSRTLAVQIIAVIGNVVLARLLIPQQFGIIAVGLTLLVFARFIGDAGLGASLIRRRESLNRVELESILGLQLILTTAVAVGAALAAPFAEVAAVTAIMVASLPLTVLRTPASIVLERELSYRPVAWGEVIEAAAYYMWAIATVASGWGVWGVATATPIRALAGTATILLLTPSAVWRPRLCWPSVRPLLGFGARFQAVGLVNLLRDQGLNVGTAAVGGVAMLGLWSLAYRVLQIPFLLFTSLWRVSYPAMSKLVSAGRDAKEAVERSVRITALASGLILVPLVGAGPELVSTILGDRWNDAEAVIPWASLGLLIGGPVSVATAGFLWAAGEAKVPLRATVLHAMVWLALALPLLSSLGVAALGVGWLAASIVDSIVLARGARKHVAANIFEALIPTATLAVLAGGTGWSLASAIGDDLASIAVGAVGGEILFVCSVALLSRHILAETLSIGKLVVSR
jgi:O-antigen/teichoic acid export membrane protein